MQHILEFARKRKKNRHHHLRKHLLCFMTKICQIRMNLQWPRIHLFPDNTTRYEIIRHERSHIDLINQTSKIKWSLQHWRKKTLTFGVKTRRCSRTSPVLYDFLMKVQSGPKWAQRSNPLTNHMRFYIEKNNIKLYVKSYTIMNLA